MFRILKSSVTDALAYISACAAAVCWVVHAWYPAALPGALRDTTHLAVTALAVLLGGMMVAKYVLLDGYARSVRVARAEAAANAASVRQLEATLSEARQERDRAVGREAALQTRLKRHEGAAAESELSSLRRRLRSDVDDRTSAVAYLLRELRSQIQELDYADDPDLAHAAGVLTKQTALLEDEIKKGDKSLYELTLAMSELQRHAHELATVRLQTAGGRPDGSGGAERSGDVPWFKAEADPARIDGVYKFLKVAFHPDRFPSEALKEQATLHFQQAGKAYSHLKERLRTTH